MHIDDYHYFARLLKKHSGLVIGDDKLYLLESRLTPIMHKWGLKDLGEMASRLRFGTDKSLLQTVIEAMTTNESFFFRDNTPFETLRDVILPQMREARGNSKSLRIWSSAASTGQEPYSIAMVFDEDRARWHDWNIEIIGTDLSHEVIDRAKSGVYSQFEVQRGLPIHSLTRYFDKDADQWRVKPVIRNMVKFKQLNLLEPFQSLGTFDIIFCRNVLIYFDSDTKADVLRRLGAVCASDGALFLGAAETVLGLTTQFRPARDRRGLYIPVTHPGFASSAAKIA
ncbi:MAG: protein-glutamate O-methyltransferase [Pseudomonadota bacterium]